ncbi:MAG TPA: 3-hydroxyacyl-CoA dehydrogenase family protein [Burkholderiales bacterium]|nr:3-hydroxyacyl-CoA dehydrogenase family protein [Burkholderiales bacterium]
MLYQLTDTGKSRSFPTSHALLEKAEAAGDVVVIVGEKVGAALQTLTDRESKVAVLIELGTEPLAVHTGERRATEGSNLVGFSRFRLGSAEPSALVELVRQPRTDERAIAAAKEIFEAAGLQVAICGDFDGRILERLVRPYYNAALRRLDEGLASADDLDTTLRLGLGYPEGPIALLERTGLEHHYDVTQALFEALGDPAYAPARRARVAKQRSKG